jgi:peptide/nickel transport system substrate-binding protein
MAYERVTRREVLIRGGGASAGLFGLGALLAACGGGGGAGSAGGAPVTGKRGGELIWALSVDPVNLAPYGVPLGDNVIGKEAMYDSLLQWDKDLKIQPALAESYTTPKPNVYEFKLRQGVKFHDGSDMTSKDVVYSLKLQKNPPPPGGDSQLGQYPMPAQIEAVDDYTVRLTYAKPDARLPGYLAWDRYSPIIPEGMYDKVDARVEGIGTGPFKLVEFRTNDRVVYERNPDFWNPDLPAYDKLTLPVMPDEQGRVAALRSGQIHGATVSADIAQTLANDPNLQVIKGLSPAYRELEFTIKPGPAQPWHDRRVRQAISHAIDRQAIIDRAYAGAAEISGFIPPGYGDWPLSKDELESNYLKYDVDQARKLMADAGLQDGFSMTMESFAGIPDYEQTAALIQQQLKAIKVDMRIKPLEPGTFAQHNGEGTFDVQLTARGMRGDVDGFVVDYDPTTPGYKNWFPGLKDIDPQIATLIQQGRRTVDQAERKPIYTKLQQLILQEALHVTLCAPYRFQVLSKKLVGMYVGLNDFNPGLRTVRFAS